MSMNVGDSSSFLVNADSFFLKTVGMTQLPPWLKPGDKMQMNIALKSMLQSEIAWFRLEPKYHYFCELN